MHNIPVTLISGRQKFQILANLSSSNNKKHSWLPDFFKLLRYSLSACALPKSEITFCSYRNTNTSLIEGIFFKTPYPPPWKLQFSFILSFEYSAFEDTQPHPPPPKSSWNFQSLLWGECVYFVELCISLPCTSKFGAHYFNKKIPNVESQNSCIYTLLNLECSCNIPYLWTISKFETVCASIFETKNSNSGIPTWTFQIWKYKNFKMWKFPVCARAGTNSPIGTCGGSGMVQWSERSSPTNVARVQFLDSHLYMYMYLSHAIENTANQKARNLLHILQYATDSIP